MGKYILLMLLAVGSNRAIAEWVSVSGSGSTTVYVDISTFRKDGNKVKMWILQDSKTAKPTTPPYMSSKEEMEFDCAEEQSRALYRSFHSGNMGAGETVHTSPDPDKWKPVPPESIIEVVWKLACGK